MKKQSLLAVLILVGSMAGQAPGKCPYSGEDFSQHRLSAGDGGKGEWLV
jgi:hypothetical protein